MADEKKPAKSGENRNRRRYFRRKAGERQPAPETPPVRVRGAARSENKSEPAQAADGRMRTASRRRRRGKGRRSGADVRTEVVAVLTDINENMALPPSVFIYTHTIWPDSKDSYEFRSEHFSKVGRTLEDYNIDISTLFLPEESAASRIAAAFADMDFDNEEDDPPPQPPEPAQSTKRPSKERGK